MESGRPEMERVNLIRLGQSLVQTSGPPRLPPPILDSRDFSKGCLIASWTSPDFP